MSQIWSDCRRQGRLALRHLRYGRASYGSGSSPLRRAELTKLFRGVNSFLRELNVEYALVYGTLLGWYREKDILEHDRDVDFGAPVGAYERIRSSASRLPPGFRLYDTSFRHQGPKLYVEHGGWEADIYFYAEERDQLRSLERSSNPGDMLPFPRAFLLPRQPAEFLGEATFVPAQPEALLHHVYRYLGKDAVRDPKTRYFTQRKR